MNLRYQHGHIRCRKRKNGSSCWEFMWREQDSSGKRKRRTSIIGTIERYPTKELAQTAVNGLRMRINEERNRQPNYVIKVNDLIDHYIATELATGETRHSHATRIIYREFLIRWIKPRWGTFNVTEVRTIAVETWLRELRRRDGEDLANATKAKIRNVMSVLFNHAIRYEWLEKNPISLVRQSAQRRLIPPVLEPDEVQCLLAQLENPFRAMVLLDVTTGLRRSELFALKWKDIDFSNLLIGIKRSIFLGVVGRGKNETSRQSVPLSLNVAADLWLWKETSRYAEPDDWVFASPRTKGNQPLRPEGVLSKIIRSAAVRAGIRKRIGWHTFRHTYSSTLIANGENVKVVQELMRHASSRFTLEVYTQAKAEAKRDAQQRLTEMMLPEEGLAELRMQRSEPPEMLGGDAY
jgi:integrase